MAGLVIGMAAKSALANLIAGIQLALTQPIRLDDVVIIEGEWGRIEEITAAYVVVMIWDQRRLVVPLSYFMRTPFKIGRTRPGELMGTVFLYVDYTAPLDELRAGIESRHAAIAFVGQARQFAASHGQHGADAAIACTGEHDRLGKAVGMCIAQCAVCAKTGQLSQRNHPSCLPRLRAEMNEFPPRAAGEMAPSSQADDARVQVDQEVESDQSEDRIDGRFQGGVAQDEHVLRLNDQPLAGSTRARFKSTRMGTWPPSAVRRNTSSRVGGTATPLPPPRFRKPPPEEPPKLCPKVPPAMAIACSTSMSRSIGSGCSPPCNTPPV